MRVRYEIIVETDESPEPGDVAYLMLATTPGRALHAGHVVGMSVMGEPVDVSPYVVDDADPYPYVEPMPPLAERYRTRGPHFTGCPCVHCTRYTEDEREAREVAKIERDLEREEIRRKLWRGEL